MLKWGTECAECLQQLKYHQLFSAPAETAAAGDRLLGQDRGFWLQDFCNKSDLLKEETPFHSPFLSPNIV